MVWYLKAQVSGVYSRIGSLFFVSFYKYGKRKRYHIAESNWVKKQLSRSNTYIPLSGLCKWNIQNGIYNDCQFASHNFQENMSINFQENMSINFPRYIITFLILISSEGSYEIFQMRNGVSQGSGNMIYSMNKNYIVTFSKPVRRSHILHSPQYW